MDLLTVLIAKDELLKKCNQQLDIVGGKFKGEDFIVVYNNRTELSQFINNLRQELVNNQIEFDDVIEYLLGDRKKWGFSDKYNKCSTCRNIICFVEERDLDNETAFFINPEAGEINCKDCVENKQELRDKYLSIIINNYYTANTILPASCFKDLDFTLHKTITSKEKAEDFNSEKIFHSLKEQGYKEIVFDLVCQREQTKKFKIWVKQ